MWIRIRIRIRNTGEITLLGRERSVGRRPTGPGGILPLFARPEGGLLLLLQGPVPAPVRHEAHETRPK